MDFRVKPTAGLGAYPGSQLSIDDVTKSPSHERWIKAQDRYARLNAANPTSLDTVETSSPTPIQSETTSAEAEQIKLRWVRGQ